MLILIILNFLLKRGWLTLPDGLIKHITKVKGIGITKSKFFILIVIAFATISLSFTNKNEDNFPSPKGIVNQLFYLQRDPDTNTLVYKLNIVNGELNDLEPVSVFWIRYAEGGKIKELSSMQKRLAYGIKSRKIEKDKHELSFVSYPDLKLLLMKSSKRNSYQVYTMIEKQQIVLNRIFVRTNKNSIGWPNVVYIELNGETVDEGKAIKYRIYI